MQEKRRSKRIPANLELKVSKLFQQEGVTNLDTEVPIVVTDVSRLGIGFVTKADLPLHYYFNAKLELGDPDNSLYCVVQLVRKRLQEDGLTNYGCEFVGMAPVLGFIFEEYEERIAAAKEA
ncbi:MAG: PilZ domain-containing protein [Lachnospiraceae bacterium]